MKLQSIKKVALDVIDGFLGHDPLDRHNWYKASQLHKPQRLDGETQEQYRARQRRSRAVANAMQRPPQQEPAKTALDFSRFFLGQRRNGKANVKRERNALYGGRQARIAKKVWAAGEDYVAAVRDSGQHPDHSALREQEAKAARGRSARRKRAMGAA